MSRSVDDPHKMRADLLKESNDAASKIYWENKQSGTTVTDIVDRVYETERLLRELPTREHHHRR